MFNALFSLNNKNNKDSLNVWILYQPMWTHRSSYAMETVGMELSSGEPSESGELPPRELTMEQRAERRQGKRAREPNEVAGGVDPAWSVCRLKEENRRWTSEALTRAGGSAT